MQYMLLIYPNMTTDTWSGLGEDEQRAISAEYIALRSEPGFLGGAQLQPGETATTVRGDSGETLTTDGPFIESRELLAGYYLFDLPSSEAAVALAARVPAVRLGGAVEVRALVEK